MLAPCSFLPTIVALVAVAGWTPAQWAATAFRTGDVVLAEGHLVVRDSPAGVEVFSATTGRWLALAPGGSQVRGSGDWTVLVDESSQFTAYSARLNSVATLRVASASAVAVQVHDDVAVVVEDGANPRAHAFSAQTGRWDTIALSGVPGGADVAADRFVAVVHDGLYYHGFAARTGVWSTLGVGAPGGGMQLDGNVALVDLFDPNSRVGVRQAAAFSGVRGQWALSPLYDPARPRLISHNLALIVVPAGTGTSGDFFNCAYSAYTGSWVTSNVLHTLGDITTWVGDNLIRMEDVRVSPPRAKFEAFGARPGTQWSKLQTANFSELSNAFADDWTVVIDTTTRRLWAYSGLCGGQWKAGPIASMTFPPVVGRGDHVGVLDDNGRLRAFAPSTETWAAFTPAAGTLVTDEDAVVSATGARFSACTARAGGWVLGPTIPIGRTFSTTSAGSVVAHQQTSAGVGSGDIYVFDERLNRWSLPFDPGGAARILAGRNLLIASGLSVHGYSVPRGDWQRAAVTMPLTLGAVVEENVAWLVDGRNRLWAFGALNDAHGWFDWPNGTEFVPATPTFGGPAPTALVYGMRVGVGEVAQAFASTRLQYPPITIPGIAGQLCLDPNSLLPLGAPQSGSSRGVAAMRLPITTPLPPCLQIWMQSVVIGPGGARLGFRCDPAWIF